MDPGEKEIYIAILLASCIVGGIIMCFVTIIIRNHKKFVRLQHRQLITQIAALESERKRIVSDLHDDLGPLLAAVKFQIDRLDTSLRQDRELIGKASGDLDNVLFRIRQICSDLLPDVLIRKGLFIAVNEFIEQVKERTTMQVSFKYHPASVSLQAQLHIYRMIQEMVNNAIKHSHASSLHIGISMNGSKLILEVRDNGKGFNAETVIYTSDGLGIKNIFGRANMLNGDMYLISAPEQGTTYKIEMPITCNELQNPIDDRR
jgi:signal transduction histidine kinase